MDKRILYAALLVLITAIASSAVISHSTQRGLGELRVDAIEIPTQSGVNMSCTIYSQYYPKYESPLPIIISIHGPMSSSSSLYAFNIELARRNMTVVSIEIPDLLDLVSSMNGIDLNETGYRCFQVLDYVRSNYDVVDNVFGILTHAEGFHIALDMMNFTGEPASFVAIGSMGTVYSDLNYPITGNFLLAIGDSNSQISVRTGQSNMETLSGISDFQVGITYGSLDEHTAFRLISASVTQETELTNSEFIQETCTWMICGLQGQEQLERSLDVEQQIFHYQIYSEWIGWISFAGIGLALFILVISIISEKREKYSISLQTYEN